MIGSVRGHGGEVVLGSILLELCFDKFVACDTRINLEHMLNVPLLCVESDEEFEFDEEDPNPS